MGPLPSIYGNNHVFAAEACRQAPKSLTRRFITARRPKASDPTSNSPRLMMPATGVQCELPISRLQHTVTNHLSFTKGHEDSIKLSSENVVYFGPNCGLQTQEFRTSPWIPQQGPPNRGHRLGTRPKPEKKPPKSLLVHI